MRASSRSRSLSTQLCVRSASPRFRDWETVLEEAWQSLVPGGQLVIFDVYAERRVPQSWWIEFIARADRSRRVWEPLEARASEFQLDFLPGSPHLHGGRLLLAVGRKGPSA